MQLNRIYVTIFKTTTKNVLQQRNKIVEISSTNKSVLVHVPLIIKSLYNVSRSLFKVHPYKNLIIPYVFHSGSKKPAYFGHHLHQNCGYCQISTKYNHVLMIQKVNMIAYKCSTDFNKNERFWEKEYLVYCAMVQIIF